MKREMYKLSNSQKTIFLQQIAGKYKDVSREANTMGFYCYYPQNVSFEALEKCYNELIRRHDSLRLVFVKTLFGVRQYIGDFKYTRLETVRVDGKEGLRQFIKNLKDTMKVYIYGESIKGILVDCGDGGGALVVRYHHLLTDGYSNSVIFGEFPKLYDTYAKGDEPNETFPSVKELWDYEKRYSASEQYKIDKAYWHKQYHSQPNYSFPAGKRAKKEICDVLDWSVEGETVEMFTALLEKTGATAQQQMMTITAVAVYALTGKDNFAITALSANRRTPEMKRTVGCGYNACPYFYNLDHNKPIYQIITENFKGYREMLHHCSFPTLAQIPQGWKLSMENGMNFAHSWITYSGMKQYSLEDTDYEIDYTYRDASCSQFYLGFMEIPGKRFDMFLEYQKEKFSRENVLRMQQVFLQCLDIILYHPDWTIDRIKENID
jgi:hypothetical protein